MATIPQVIFRPVPQVPVSRGGGQVNIGLALTRVGPEAIAAAAAAEAAKVAAQLAETNAETAETNAEAAQAAAEAAQAAAEAVGNTNDTIMAGVAADTGSDFYAVQAATIAAATVGVYAHRALPAKALTKLKAGTNIKITYLGDSVLQGSTATTPGTDDCASLVRTTLNSRFSVTTTKDNQAQGGRTVWWECIDKWDAAITAAPDVLVLGITGKNDAAYEAVSTANSVVKHTGQKQSSALGQVESKIREARTRLPDTSIILFSGNPYGTAYTTTNPVQKKFSQELARLAAHYGIPYADGWGATTKSAVGSDYAAASVLSDGVHPNSAGHALLANAILDLFPASWDPMTTPSTPSVALPERLYANKHAIAPKQLTTAAVTAYIDRILTPAFVGGAWTGSGPWTTSTANDPLMSKAKCTDFFIRFTYGAGQGIVDIIVDGQTYISGMDLSALTDADQWVSIPDLLPAVHTVVVKAISGSVTVERMGFVPAACEFIDIRDTRLTLTGAGAASDLNQWWGVHSNPFDTGDTITIPFVGTGIAIEAYRTTTGAGTYYTATLDGAAATVAAIPTGFGGGALTAPGPGTAPVISGLEYGYHVLVLTFVAGTLQVGGFSVLDERPELHLDVASGVAKVGETVRPSLPFADIPAVQVASTTANAAGVSTATASSFLLTGTSGDVVRWSARAPKRVLY